MSSVDKEQFDYITSERFIHDGLIRTSQAVVEEACKAWDEGQLKRGAFALVWPTSTVKDDGGNPISRAVVMELPEEARRFAALNALVQRTGAYGLLVIDLQERALVAKFETAHGARVWTIPIEWHGDRREMGDQRVKDNAECVGLLWSPARGRA